MKADHNTIMPFGVKVMSKYKVLSKHERGMIKKPTYNTSLKYMRVHLRVFKGHITNT